MPRRRTRHRRSPGLFRAVPYLLAGLALLAAAYLVYGPGEYTPIGEPQPRSPAREPAGNQPSTRPSKRPSPEPAPVAQRRPDHAPMGAEGEPVAHRPSVPPEVLPPPAGGARVALVIDDLGRSLTDLETLGKLGVPLSYSVLPFETLTPQVVGALRQRGEEILCHLPMEPANGANPGPGALRRAMSEAQLVQATREALAAVPGAVGVNHHMGSSFSTDPDAMSTVLELLGDRQLFYLDSRTSPDSVGYRIARRLGVAAAERQVFLDSDPAPAAIHHQFARLLALARSRGAAIAIGHPYPSTLATLAKEVPEARALGYEFVPVSYLMDDPGGPPL